jgi:hypothetical protein
VISKNLIYSVLFVALLLLGVKILLAGVLTWDAVKTAALVGGGGYALLEYFKLKKARKETPPKNDA